MWRLRLVLLEEEVVVMVLLLLQGSQCRVTDVVFDVVKFSVVGVINYDMFLMVLFLFSVHIIPQAILKLDICSSSYIHTYVHAYLRLNI